MELSSLILIITTILAVYGAILSTINAYQKWNENKPCIRVGYYSEYLENRKQYCVISAQNIGNKPVTMSYAYIMYGNPFGRFVLNKQKVRSPCGGTEINSSIYGKQIQSGQCLEVKYLFPDDFKFLMEMGWDESEELVGIFVDQIDNVYKSQPFTLE